MGKSKRVSEEEIFAEFQSRVETLGLTGVARLVGCTPQYIYDVQQGRRRLSDRIALALGYRTVLYYERI